MNAASLYQGALFNIDRSEFMVFHLEAHFDAIQSVRHGFPFTTDNYHTLRRNALRHTNIAIYLHKMYVIKSFLCAISETLS